MGFLSTIMAAIWGGFFGLCAYDAFGWGGIVFAIPGLLALGAGTSELLEMVFDR